MRGTAADSHTAERFGDTITANFFGLTNEYLETVYTKFFQMKMYGNWSFFEVYSLPVQLRNWFYDQLVNAKEEEAKQFKK